MADGQSEINSITQQIEGISNILNNLNQITLSDGHPVEE